VKPAICLGSGVAIAVISAWGSVKRVTVVDSMN